MKLRGRRSMFLLTGLMLLLSMVRLVMDPPEASMEQTSNWWPVINSVADGDGFRSCLPQYFPFCGPGNDISAAREPIPVLVQAGLALLSGRSLWAAVALQVLLNLAIAWLLFLFVERHASTSRGLLAAGLWGTLLINYQILPQVGGDQLAALFAMLTLYLLPEAFSSGTARRWLLVGAAAAAAMLCRSSLMALIPGILIVILARGPRSSVGRRIPAMALFLAGSLMLLAPWVVRNRVHFGTWSAGSSLSGYNVFRHNSQLPRSDRFHYVGPVQAKELVDSLITAHPELTGRENEAEMNRIYMQAGKDLVLDHPLRYAGLCLHRLFLLWSNWHVTDESGRASGPEDHLITLQSLLLLVLAILGWRRGGAADTAFLIALFLFMGMHMAVVARTRYLIPFMPFVLMHAAGGLERLLPGWKHR